MATKPVVSYYSCGEVNTKRAKEKKRENAFGQRGQKRKEKKVGPSGF